MPLYNFRCTKCHQLTKKLMAVEEYKKLPGFIACECGYTAKREMKGGTSKTMEVFDSITMAKPLERLVDAQRIFEERATLHKREYGQVDQDE
jgi:hypothetical protein